MDITSVNLSHGADSDGFAYQFLPNVGMIGEIEKGTGLIKRISIVSTPQSVNDTLGAIIAYSLVMFTFNPELKHEDNGDILDELNLSERTLPNLVNKKSVAIRGNTRYTTAFSKGAFWFIASGKDS